MKDTIEGLKSKSFLTNFLALGFVLMSVLMQDESLKRLFSNIGLFALSGGLTNWIAVHMLFEKVPGFYGSGVIENRFDDLKKSIHHLIEDQFFTTDQIKALLEKESTVLTEKVERIIAELDYEGVYYGLIESLMGSSLGGMLQMVGGPKALEPYKEKIMEKIQVTLKDYAQQGPVRAKIQASMMHESVALQLKESISGLIASKLEQMTPAMVKMIMKDMIEKHLGWLIVWGGVFGGFIGLIKSLMFS